MGAGVYQFADNVVKRGSTVGGFDLIVEALSRLADPEFPGSNEAWKWVEIKRSEHANADVMRAVWAREDGRPIDG